MGNSPKTQQQNVFKSLIARKGGAIMYLDLYSVFTLVASITVFFMLSLIFTCACWYMWSGYRDIDTDPVKDSNTTDTDDWENEGGQ